MTGPAQKAAERALNNLILSGAIKTDRQEVYNVIVTMLAKDIEAEYRPLVEAAKAVLANTSLTNVFGIKTITTGHLGRLEQALCVNNK